MREKASHVIQEIFVPFDGYNKDEEEETRQAFLPPTLECLVYSFLQLNM